MQIRTGTVSLVNGSSTIIGDRNADWSQVQAGNVLIVDGLPGVYYIAHTPTYQQATDDLGTYQQWRTDLTVNWPNATNASASYTIVKDFTANYGLPLMSAGDIETATLHSLAMARIDQLFATSGGAGTEGTTKSSFNVVVGDNSSYVIGSLVRFDSTAHAWMLANSSSAATAIVHGMVSAKVNSDTIEITTSGKVDGISYGAGTLTSGTTYYLGDGTVNPNLPTGCNYVPLSSLADSDVKIPVFIATGTSSGVLIGFTAVASTKAFTPSTPSADGTMGLVPPPKAAHTKQFLRVDGWQDLASLTFDNLLDSAFDGDWSTLAGKSVTGAIRSIGAAATTFTMGSTLIYIGDPNRTFTVPNGVTRLRVTCWSPVVYHINSYGVSSIADYGTATQVILKVTAGMSFTGLLGARIEDIETGKYIKGTTRFYLSNKTSDHFLIADNSVSAVEVSAYYGYNVSVPQLVTFLADALIAQTEPTGTLDKRTLTGPSKAQGAILIEY